MAATWFYVENGEQAGPIHSSQLKELAAAGRIGPETMVWKEGMAQWTAARRVKGLFPIGIVEAGLDVAPLAVAEPAPSPAYRTASTSIADATAPQALGYYNAAAAGAVEYAGFWIRFCAAFLDNLILSVAGAFVGFVIGASLAVTGTDPNLIELMAQLAGIVIGWLYCALMESSPMQATLGKKICGIMVTDLSGERISFGRATGRHFGKFVSTLILLIGYIMAAFTERKQALHDIMASTLVVKGQA